MNIEDGAKFGGGNQIARRLNSMATIIQKELGCEEEEEDSDSIESQKQLRDERIAQ